MKYLLPGAVALFVTMIWVVTSSPPAGGMTVEPAKCWEVASPPVQHQETRQVWMLVANGCGEPEAKWIQVPAPPSGAA
jgi:hypothetical protein